MKALYRVEQSSGRAIYYWFTPGAPPQPVGPWKDPEVDRLVADDIRRLGEENAIPCGPEDVPGLSAHVEPARVAGGLVWVWR